MVQTWGHRAPRWVGATRIKLQSKGRTSQFKLSRTLKLEQDQHRLDLIIVMEKLQESEAYIRLDSSQRKTLQWISTWIKSNSSQGTIT